MQTSSVFQDVSSGVAPVARGLDPRATRWGIVPIRPINDLPANAFKLQTFPANKFVPLRPFEYANVMNGETHGSDGRAHTRTRTPHDQVLDLATVGAEKFATDLPELATLENEAAERQILTMLANPNTCEKYPNELGNNCTTCWLTYLETTAPGKVIEVFGADSNEATIAKQTATRLINTFRNALQKARNDVDAALREVDSPHSAKNEFQDVDYLNIWHTHQDNPQFRTTANANNQIGEIAKAIGQAMNANTQPVLSADDIKALVATQMAESLAAKEAEIAELKAQLEEKKKGK